jgi:hypothetical protein
MRVNIGSWLFMPFSPMKDVHDLYALLYDGATGRDVPARIRLPPINEKENK